MNGRLRVGLLFTALVGALGVYGMAASPLFRVEQVVVTGASARQREALLARLVGVEREHLLAVDVRAASRAVQGEPRVAFATVRRRLPSTLEVEVEPRQPVAQFPYGQGFFEVDKQGRVLGPAEAKPGSLPIISGALAPEEAVEVGRQGPQALQAAALALAAALSVLGERVSQAHVDLASGQLTILLSDGSVLQWGGIDGQAADPAVHERRARVLRAVLAQLPADRPWSADLSDPDRVVWRPFGGGAP